jgi:hypothetical protein
MTNEIGTRGQESEIFLDSRGHHPECDLDAMALIGSARLGHTAK